MSGVFRYAKSIAGSLALTALAVSAKSGQSWIFYDVGDLNPAAAVVSRDAFSGSHQSLSPMRRSAAGDVVTW